MHKASGFTMLFSLRQTLNDFVILRLIVSVTRQVAIIHTRFSVAILNVFCLTNFLKTDFFISIISIIMAVLTFVAVLLPETDQLIICLLLI